MNIKLEVGSWRNKTSVRQRVRAHELAGDMVLHPTTTRCRARELQTRHTAIQRTTLRVDSHLLLGLLDGKDFVECPQSDADIRVPVPLETAGNQVK